MRNNYAGVCYFCGENVEVGEGHFEKSKFKGFILIHASCVFTLRENKQKGLSEKVEIIINTPTCVRMKTNLGIFEKVFRNQAWSFWYKLGEQPFGSG